MEVQDSEVSSDPAVCSRSQSLGSDSGEGDSDSVRDTLAYTETSAPSTPVTIAMDRAFEEGQGSHDRLHDGFGGFLVGHVLAAISQANNRARLRELEGPYADFNPEDTGIDTSD
eukprot:2703461-Amphidinium_carterae.2